MMKNKTYIEKRKRGRPKKQIFPIQSVQVQNQTDKEIENKILSDYNDIEKLSKTVLSQLLIQGLQNLNQTHKSKEIKNWESVSRILIQTIDLISKQKKDKNQETEIDIDLGTLLETL